jgi:hypothetical protein
VWTSGSNEGENCDFQRKYSWCSAEKPFSTLEESFWAVKNATNSTLQRCIAFKRNKTSAETAGFIHVNCGDKLPFLCTMTSLCPPMYIATV